MSQTQHPAVNPFALLTDPQAVFRAIESSERLARLHSRVCRPLDRPLLPVAAADDVGSFDHGVEQSADEVFVEPVPSEGASEV